MQAAIINHPRRQQGLDAICSRSLDQLVAGLVSAYGAEGAALMLKQQIIRLPRSIPINDCQGENV